MTSTTNERAFEAAIENHLYKFGGYTTTIADYSPELAFFPQIIFQFIQHTQPEAWAELETIHGETTNNKFQQRLFKELDNRGMLDVLRHGITDYGVRFKLAYFKPASTLNPETLAYEMQKTVDFPCLASAKQAKTLPEKIKAIVYGEDKGARFAWKVVPTD